MKAVIYARYSCDNQREESIEGQLRECTAFAEKNGITILSHYIDRAYSAKTDNRPEFQRMIKDSSKKLFDVVLVWKLDRFARNRYDSARYKSILKKNGVKVVSATEVISDGAEGIILESVLEGYAEYYSADLSEKVVRGMTENVLKCKNNGGGLSIGYYIDSEQRFQIDKPKANLVVEAFKLYDGGKTMKEISDWLNEQGLKNPRNLPITRNTVERMLKNRRYIGEYRYRETVVPKGIPQIVPDDLFERVQKKIEKNKKAPARYKADDDYILTTKLFCGHCGAMMCGECGTSHTSEVYHYYKCAARKQRKNDCKKKTVKKQWIEDLVVNEAMKIIMSDERVDAIVSKIAELLNKENTNIPMYEKELRDINSGIQNMLDAIQQGILTRSMKERLEKLEAQRDELEILISREALEKPKPKEEFIRFWILKFRMLDTTKKEHRQKLIDTFINAVFLFDDKLVITFNYKDGNETVKFSELKGSDINLFGAPKILSRKRKDFYFFSLHSSFFTVIFT